jgi:hypothetical protein
MVERGGFEPPRPFGNRWAEFCPSLAHNLALKEESMLERIGSLTIRLLFGSLWSLGCSDSSGSSLPSLWRTTIEDEAPARNNRSGLTSTIAFQLAGHFRQSLAQSKRAVAFSQGTRPLATKN